MTNRFRPALAALCLLAAISAMAGNARGAEKIPVVASFSILADLIAQVGGERVAVSALVGANADAHEFQPTPSDVRRLAGARLVVVNGMGFEGWMDRLARNANYKGTVSVASEGVKQRLERDDGPQRDAAGGHRHGHGDKHGHGGGDGGGGQIDPHAWQNPMNAAIYVRNIAAALSALDPAGAADYQRNARRYQAELSALDDWARSRLATIAADRRVVITSHDAFGYFADHYGVRFLAPQGVSTDSQPGARAVGMLVRQIRQQRIKAVFVENMTNPALLAQLARDTGVSPGAPLYADALSAGDGPAPTYLRMMRYNVDRLMEGLKKN
jgi:zinc/manganese transport system substrate-binding protein